MLANHLVILPILVPLLGALLQLLPWGDNPQHYRRIIGIVASAVTLVLAILLVVSVQDQILVYALGSWQAPMASY